MMDLLRIGTTFDWISPLLAFMGDVRHGGGVTFGIIEGAGWSGREVERLLHRHGVKTWGLMAVNDGDSPTGGTILVTVKAEQAKWAFTVLQRAGVPLLFAPEVGRPDEVAGLDAEMEVLESWLES